MKVLFITVGTIGTASTRMRVFNYLPGLQQAGIETRVVLAPRGRGILRSSLWKNLLWPDVIFVQKAELQPWLLEVLNRIGKPCIFDIDDALFALPAYMIPSEVERAAHVEGTNRMMRWADIVCVANSYIKRYALTQNPSVTLIPMGVDCSVFHPADSEARHRSVPVVGWIGAADSRHFENVKLLAEPLSRLAAKRPLVFRLVGLRDDERFAPLFDKTPNLQFETVSWLPAHHIPTAVKQLDVGLAPLIEDEWTVGKSPTKALEYMASGVVTVASAVGVQNEFIQDGVDGFLASSPAEWIEKIELALTASPEVALIRHRALEKVRNQYSIEACTSALIAMLERVASIRADKRVARQPN